MQYRRHRPVPAAGKIRAATATLAGCCALLLVACSKPAPAPVPRPPAPAASAPAGDLGRLQAGLDEPEQAVRIANGDNVSVTGGNSYAHVTYASQVRMLDESVVQSALVGIGSDGHGFLFHDAPAQISGLVAGDVMMVKGAMAARVLGVVNADGDTLVELDQAALGDIVAEGDVNIEAPVRFHGPRSSARATPPASAPRIDSASQPERFSLLDLLGAAAHAQSGLAGSTHDLARQQGTQDAAVNAAKKAKDFATSGWKVTKWSIVPGDGQADFSLVMTKDVGGFVARVAMKGWIGDFDFATGLSLQGVKNARARATARQLYSGVKNMPGSIQFDWEIGKASPGVWATEDRVKLPVGLTVSLAPLLAGMPLTLDVSSALLIHPALTGGDEYSRGGFSIAWKGSGKFEGKSGGAVSGDNTITTEYGVTTDANISPVAPNGMVISYCAPRIELRLDILGPFASKLASFGSTIDKRVKQLESRLPPAILDALAKSPVSKVTASNILASNADVFVQFIATEGTTHSSSQTPFPCSKQEIKFTAQGGTSAQFFGLTDGAKSIADLYTKTFTRWDPASDFCKKV